MINSIEFLQKTDQFLKNIEFFYVTLCLKRTQQRKKRKLLRKARGGFLGVLIPALVSLVSSIPPFLGGDDDTDDEKEDSMSEDNSDDSAEEEDMSEGSEDDGVDDGEEMEGYDDDIGDSEVDECEAESDEDEEGDQDESQSEEDEECSSEDDENLPTIRFSRKRYLQFCYFSILEPLRQHNFLTKCSVSFLKDLNKLLFKVLHDKTVRKSPYIRSILADLRSNKVCLHKFASAKSYHSKRKYLLKCIPDQFLILLFAKLSQAFKKLFCKATASKMNLEESGEINEFDVCEQETDVTESCDEPYINRYTCTHFELVTTLYGNVYGK